MRNLIIGGVACLARKQWSWPAHVPAVPALTTVYLYSSRWQLVPSMPTDCQWQEGMDRFQPPNLSAELVAKPYIAPSPQTLIAGEGSNYLLILAAYVDSLSPG